MDLGMDWLDLNLDLNEPLAHSPALAEWVDEGLPD